MIFTSANIRNICLLGHRGNGKTSLVESLLYWNGKTDRLGTIAQGNTICDSDPEEIKRKTTVELSAVHLEYNNVKINLIDGPGFYDFVGENISAVEAADSALIVVSAKQSVSVGAEKAMMLTKNSKMPKAIYISFLDDENADYFSIIDQLGNKFGPQQICPFWLPLMENGKPVGIIEVLSEKAYKLDGNKKTEVTVPEDMLAHVAEYKEKLTESIAETSEELMNKYFNGEDFSEEELMEGVQSAVLQRLIFPVICGISNSTFAMEELVRFFTTVMPSPDQCNDISAQDNGNDISLTCNSDDPTAMRVFKTMVDPFVGKLSFVKVLSGKVVKEETYLNSCTGAKEKISHVYIPFAKKQDEVDTLFAGDIGVFTKLTMAKTGDVLCDKNHVITLELMAFPKPYYARAVAPVTKGEDEKMSSGIQRLMEQDPTIQLVQNKETKQMVLYGVGDMQLDILVNRLAAKPFSVNVVLSDVRVAYRETIRKKVKVEGKHKKQSGGHGQYGDVWIEFEPSDEDFVFAETVFGGAVPKNYFPAVEKGLRESIQAGVLAGYPVTGLKATLTDGSYHPVDSSEMAFKIAASIAFKEGMKQAGPTLLEPIGRLKVNVSDALMGDIIGDINKRRGQVLSMDAAPEHARKIVEADVPMSEMSDYSMGLRSMTHGRATFELEFLEYREAPSNIIEKIVKEQN